MIKLTDSNGNLFPAIRNLINLIWLTVGFVAGWGGNIVWNRQAESDQLVQDAAAMVDIRAEKHVNEAVLKENIENAKKLESNDCLQSRHESYVRKLRAGREKGRGFDK